MAFRCPYCQTRLKELPDKGVCPACRRQMILPSSATAAERAARRRKRERMQMEAARQREAIFQTPAGRIFRSPKVLLGFMLVMAVLGGLLVRKVEPLPEAKTRIPHQVALMHLDALATALGRYRFHVGEYPTTEEGLMALLNNPGKEGWDGPYVNQLLHDPWRTPFQYERSNDVVRLFTSGPDKIAGTADDLRPDPAAFDPGTEWTNGWVSAIDRLPGALILQQYSAEETAGDGDE